MNIYSLVQPQKLKEGGNNTLSKPEEEKIGIDFQI